MRGNDWPSSDRVAAAYLVDTTARFEAIRDLVERALEQVDDAGFFAQLDTEANSIAILMKHMAGNLRSRFTDFLSSDGEKPWRDRDAEFMLSPTDSREAVEAEWAKGWHTLLSALRALRPVDLLRRVTIRGEPHTVLQALSRQLVHQSQHAGQIVLLARHHAGPGWRTLSVPRGQSAQFTLDVRARHRGGAA